jgi:uncharacterized membrane-anchored protein YjiN (DUF445 family)
MGLPGFTEVVSNAWNREVKTVSSATRIDAKFKNVRYALKKWSKSTSNLNHLITNCNEVTLVIDKLEEQRSLFLQEKNLRSIIKTQIDRLLKYKNSYWRQSYTERWVTLGDECTKFFHATTTNRYMHNAIASLVNEEGINFLVMIKSCLSLGGIEGSYGDL